MKKLLNIIFLLLIFNSCGTDQDYKNYKFTLINLSGYNIKIDAYSPDRKNINTIEIRNQEEITKKFKAYMGDIYTYLDFFEGYSIVVTHNNEKRRSFIQVLKCEEEEENPLNSCLYRDTEEIFIFTTQDYNNAEFCNGSCK